MSTGSPFQQNPVTYGGPLTMDGNGSAFASLMRPPANGNNNNNRRTGSNTSNTRRNHSNNRRNNAARTVSPDPADPGNQQVNNGSAAAASVQPAMFVSNLRGVPREIRNVNINGSMVRCSHSGRILRNNDGSPLTFDRIRGFLATLSPGTPIVVDVRQAGTNNAWSTWSGVTGQHGFSGPAISRATFNGTYVAFDARASDEITGFLRSCIGQANLDVVQETPFVEIGVPMRGIEYRRVETFRTVFYSPDLNETPYVIDLESCTNSSLVNNQKYFLSECIRFIR